MKNAELSNLAQGFAALAQYNDVVQPGLLAREQARQDLARQARQVLRKQRKAPAKKPGFFPTFSNFFALYI